MEFTHGGDPGLPLRVLVSAVKPHSVSSDSKSDDGHTKEEETEGPEDNDYRKRFLELILSF